MRPLLRHSNTHKLDSNPILTRFTKSMNLLSNFRGPELMDQAEDRGFSGLGKHNLEMTVFLSSHRLHTSVVDDCLNITASD